jgi:flagellar hook assembly protein FlgD
MLELRNVSYTVTDNGKKDILKVELETSSEDLWQGSIKSNKNEVVQNLTWQGKATSFDWNGTDEEGNLVKDGTYQFEISCTDKAGNKVSKKIDNIKMDTRSVKAYITSDLDAFSPNGDGTKDVQKLSIRTNLTEGIESWNVSVLDSTGKSVASWSNEDTKDLPSVINWDGKVNKEGYSINISNVNVPVPSGYIKPSGTKTITENGTFDISSFASAVVNIPTAPTICKMCTVTIASDLGNGTNTTKTLLTADDFVKAHYADDGFAVHMIPVTPVANATGVTHSVFHANYNVASSDVARYGYALYGSSATALGFMQSTAKISGNGYNVSLRAKSSGNLDIYAASNRTVKAGTYMLIMTIK